MTDYAIKLCTKCGIVKPVTEFGRNRARSDGYVPQCKECVRQYREARREEDREYQRQYREEHREEVQQYQRDYREAHSEERRQYQAQYGARYYEANRERANERSAVRHKTARDKVLAHYSTSSPPRCACCGTIENLTIDHVNGDGRAHRETLGIYSGANFYRWLVERGFPAEPSLQVLCNLCNISKSDGERCRLVHQEPANRGERTVPSRLTWDLVREMRERRAAGETLSYLASCFGVHVSNVSLICSGKTWQNPPSER